MEIKNAKVASLSNFEVMKHLHQIKDSRMKNKGQLATITYETLKHLEQSPCKTQTGPGITNCIKQLEPLNLTKNEKLMIVNNPPTTPLEIQLIVDNSEERLTEEQVENLLATVRENFEIEVNDEQVKQVLQ